MPQSRRLRRLLIGPNAASTSSRLLCPPHPLCPPSHRPRRLSVRHRPSSTRPIWCRNTTLLATRRLRSGRLYPISKGLTSAKLSSHQRWQRGLQATGHLVFARPRYRPCRQSSRRRLPVPAEARACGRRRWRTSWRKPERMLCDDDRRGKDWQRPQRPARCCRLRRFRPL